MADPSVASEHGAGLLGVKLASLIAGFAGGVVSLSFVRELTKTQSALAVFTGATTAAYGTPVLMYYLGLPTALENGAAFFTGLTAMNIVPGVLKISDAFRRYPIKFADRKDGGDRK